MTAHNQIEGLLADLSTITDVARAGVISRHEERLEPGEMRLVAVLFLDIVGFTPLTKRIGAEGITKLIDRTFRIFELTVKAQGGYATGFAGDSAHYIFAGHANYPPVCEAALRTALKLKERVRQVNESLSETGITIMLRTGVSFGEVTVQAVGSEKAQTTIMGDAINMAQRLESTAKPNTIQTVEHVLTNAGDIFQSKPLGEKNLKGLGAVMTYEVTGVEERPVALRGAFRKLTKLTGRDDTLRQTTEMIEKWWQTTYGPETWDITQVDKLPTGRNRVLIISGVAAVGKSRLGYELVERLVGERGVAAAVAHCMESTNLQAFAAELASVAGVSAENLPERWEELCAHAGNAVNREYAERCRRHLPLLAHLLGCTAVDTSGIAQADASSFAMNCKLVLRSCCELTAHFTASPVILLVEDLQWLGDMHDVLKDILEHALTPFPLVIVGTARPEYKHKERSLGEGEAHVLELDRLSRKDGDKLVRAIMPGLELPEHIVNDLHSKAAGIPYYYEEFCRMLLRRGLVEPAVLATGTSQDMPSVNDYIQDSVKFALVRDIEELDTPEDISTFMLGRLDQLGEELKGLAQRASVIGRRFPRELLAMIETALDYRQPGHPNEGLASLVDSGILVHGWDNSTDEPSRSGDYYIFEHVLLYESAYHSLLQRNRRLLHNVAAQVLEAMCVPGSVSEMQLLNSRVQHLCSARQHEAAHHCCSEILLLKARSGSFEDWDRWEGLAEECVSRATKDSVAQPNYSCTLMRARGVRLLRQGDYSAARQHFDDSLAAARQARDEQSMASALCDLGILSKHAGHADEAMDYYQQAIEVARQVGDRQTEAVVLGNIGRIHYQQGDIELAIEHYEQALAISREHGDKRSEAAMLVYLGTLYLEHGESEQASGIFNDVLKLVREIGNRVTESIALSNLGVAAHNLGKEGQARLLWQQAAGIDREIGRREGEAFHMFNLGELAYKGDELEQAMDYFARSLELFRQQGNSAHTALALAEMGKVLAQRGQLEEAAAALTEASTMCDSLQHMAEKGITDCCWTYFYLATNDLPKAQDHLTAAHLVAQQISAGSESQLSSEIEQAAAMIALARTSS
jgi:class 3 adenylate cyclase/tetratricopeptide (TPR) repeat protein